MALSDINSNLFKPLASRNAPFYTRAIEAIYKRVAETAFEVECTPKEAREIIRNTLATSDLALDLFESSSEELIFEDIKDKGGQIYDALKSFGWFVEIDDVGYRRIIFMPLEAMRLCASLLKLQKPREHVNFRSTYEGVSHALGLVASSPNEQADMLEKAAIDAQSFIYELHSITGGIRESANDLQNKRSNAEIYSVFFEDMIGDLFRRYDEANAKNNPRVIHRKINRSITRLLINEKNEIAIIAKQLGRISSKDKAKSQEELENEVKDQLHQIYDIFKKAPELIERIAKYRSSVTKRVKEAMIYSATAPVMLGRDISDVIAAIDAEPFIETLPSSISIVGYISPERLYKPKSAPVAAVANQVRERQIDYKELAKTHLFNEALKRRARDPYRLIAYIESAMKEWGNTIISDQLPIHTIDDLIAYEQTRELINRAPTTGTPFYPLNDMYDVRFIDGTTENEYLVSPRISITRKTVTNDAY